jgi:hypothetical protein
VNRDRVNRAWVSLGVFSSHPFAIGKQGIPRCSLSRVCTDYRQCSSCRIRYVSDLPCRPRYCFRILTTRFLSVKLLKTRVVVSFLVHSQSCQQCWLPLLFTSAQRKVRFRPVVLFPTFLVALGVDLYGSTVKIHHPRTP